MSSVLASAPARVSIAGGGTDIPTYYQAFGGICLNAAINIRQHVVYSDERGKDELPKGADKDLWQAIKKEFKVEGHIYSTFEGIIGAGLGSSASFAVCAVAALYKLRGKEIILEDVINDAYRIESKIRLTGKQDYYASAYGGLNILSFGRVLTKVTRIESSEFLKYLVLISGPQRQSPQDQKHFNAPNTKKIEQLHSIKLLALRTTEAILSGDIMSTVRLMRSSWDIKKKLSPLISSDAIDIIYEEALKRGALAGKLLGAGGGGYMLFIVPPEQRTTFIEAMEGEGFKHTDCSVTLQGVEARIL